MAWYNFDMPIQLSDDELNRLQENSAGIRCEDHTTKRVYVLMDEDVHSKAMAALREQQDWKAIQEGIEAADAGQTMSLEEADVSLREEFGFPSAS
ncbi:MAG TPA: hypothetical protein EYG03_30250 [Planctomycetes bacterium]|nr:hypothetical protein [Fuerstiella sp.]HIK96246.1 hypothetical protein [Planctomycetota bacterium]